MNPTERGKIMSTGTVSIATSRKLKAVMLAILVIGVFTLGVKASGFFYAAQQSLELQRKELLNRYSSTKDPREECLRDLFMKEESPSLWQIRKCSKKEKRKIL